MSLPTSRLQRGELPIIGRSAELAVADRWIDLAFEGSPRVGIVRGDPGIGKSRFAGAVAQRAARRGFLVLRTTGQADVGPSLLPMLTMLLPLIDQARAGRRPDLQQADHEALSALAMASQVDVGDEPQRLHVDDTQRYLAAVRLLLGAARSRPVLLVVDDAHVLDEASTGLLAHLVAAAAHTAEGAPVRLLTLVALRRSVSRQSSRAALNRLRREEGASELELAGLDDLGLNELLTALGPAPPSRPLLWSMLRRTKGNPLFAELLWSHLLDAGAARVDRGLVIAEPTAAELARVGLDDVVDIRLELLSDRCRDLLGVAAVLGDRNDIDVLAEVADTTEADVEDLLAEADDVGVCQLDERRYRFDHPLIAAALVRRVPPGRRRRLHRDIAASLTRRQRATAVEVAAHLSAAGDLAGPDECRRWGVAAAEQALQLAAWGDARAGFALALDDGRDEGFAPAERLDLCLRAASACAADHDLQGCERFGGVAITIARQLGDLDAWCKALGELSHCRVRVIPGGSAPSTRELQEFIAATEDRVPHLRARILALLAEHHFTAFDFDGGRMHAMEATRLAKAAGDDSIIAFVSFVEGLQHQGRLDLDDSDRCFKRSIEHADAAGSRSVAAWARARVPSALWLRGRLAEAMIAADDAEPRAGETHDWAELSIIAAWRANIAGAAGSFAEAERLSERALVRQRRSDYAFTRIVAYPVLTIARAIRGDGGGAHQALTEWRQAGATRFADHLDVLVDSILGDAPAVLAALDRAPWPEVRDGPVDLRRGGTLMAQVGIAAAVGDGKLAAAAIGPLTELHGRGVRFVPGSLSLVSRLCGLAVAVEGGDPAGALHWIDVARHEARAAGAEAELARCDLDEALLRRTRSQPGDDDATERLLVAAVVAFDRLGMLPFLRTAELHLGGQAGGAPRARKVILFTDLVDSTKLNTAAGDESYVQLLRAHDRIVRSALRGHSGVEFKHTGDGVAAWFASANQAVLCALELQEHLTGLLQAESGLAVQIRCGLAAGEPIEEGGDLFGIAVVRASRICAEAQGGTVLVAEEVQAMARDASLRFSLHREADLRGIPGRTRLLLAERGERLGEHDARTSG